jgi:hypothetical protein
MLSHDELKKCAGVNGPKGWKEGPLGVAARNASDLKAFRDRKVDDSECRQRPIWSRANAPGTTLWAVLANPAFPQCRVST